MNVTFAIIAGLVVPFVISFLKNKTWSKEVKQLVSIAVSVAVGAGIAVFDNNLDVSTWEAFATNFGVIFSVATIWYNQYFGGTAVNHMLESRGVGHESGGSDAQV